MILDGKKLAAEVKEGIRRQVKELGGDITLDVILVGNDPASQVYVRNKSNACEDVGIKCNQITLSEDVEENYILDVIETLNKDLNVDGILVQLPLPKKFNTTKILNSILPEKDVDGLHPLNAGKLFLQQGGVVPCTAAGVISLLESIPDYTLCGKNAVVLGRSNIVGKPVCQLLTSKDCTVTLTHSKTPKHVLMNMIDCSDIIVSAVGKPHIITLEDLHNYRCNISNKVIIDVGINRDTNGRLCGDFSEELKRVSLHYTPVPGGVGPMTVAMLLQNVVTLHRLRLK